MLPFLTKKLSFYREIAARKFCQNRRRLSYRMLIGESPRSSIKLEEICESTLTKRSLYLQSCGVKCEISNPREVLAEHFGGSAESTVVDIPLAKSVIKEMTTDRVLSYLVLLSTLSREHECLTIDYFRQVGDLWKNLRTDEVCMFSISAIHLLLDLGNRSNVDSKKSTLRECIHSFVEIVRLNIKKIRFPGGIILTDALIYLNDRQIVKSVQKDFLDKVSANWRLVSLPTDVTKLVGFLNAFQIYDNFRINSHIDARIGLIMPITDAKNALVFLQFAPLGKQYIHQFLEKIDTENLHDNDFDIVTQILIAKKVCKKLESFINVFMRRAKSISNKRSLLELIEPVSKFNENSITSATLATRLTKRFIQYDGLFISGTPKESKESLYQEDKLRQSSVNRTEVNLSSTIIDFDALMYLVRILSNSSRELREGKFGNTKVMTVLSALLAPLFRMDDEKINDKFKVLLIDVHFKVGMRGTTYMREYLSNLLKRGSNLNSEQMITILLASCASLKSEGDMQPHLQHLMDFIKPCIPVCNAHQLTVILEAFEAAHASSKELYEVVAKRIFQIRSDFTFKESCSILPALARVECHEHESFKALKNEIDANFVKADSADMANLLLSFARVPLRMHVDKLEQLLIEKACWKAPKAAPEDVCSILRTIAIRPLQYKLLIGCYTTRTLEVLDTLGGKELLSVFISLVKLKLSDNTVYRKMLTAILGKKYDLGESEVGELVLTCSIVFPNSPDLYQKLSLRVIAYAPILSAETCCKVMMGFAAARSNNDELFAVITNRVVDLIDKLTSSQTQSLISSFARLSVPTPALCHALLPTIAEHLIILTLQETLQVLTMFTVSKVVNHRFIKAVSSRLKYYQKGMSVVIAINIVECYATIRTDAPDLFLELLIIIEAQVENVPFFHLCRLLTALLQFPEYKRNEALQKIVDKFKQHFNNFKNIEQEKYAELHNRILVTFRVK